MPEEERQWRVAIGVEHLRVDATRRVLVEERWVRHLLQRSEGEGDAEEQSEREQRPPRQRPTARWWADDQRLGRGLRANGTSALVHLSILAQLGQCAR